VEFHENPRDAYNHVPKVYVLVFLSLCAELSVVCFGVVVWMLKRNNEIEESL
jgi:hypothetical protein